MHDSAFFGAWFSDPSWWPWWVASMVTSGLPLGEDGAALYRQCTGRTIAPTTPAREAWFIVGRRGGKSRIAALWAVYLSCFRDYTPHLAPGEVGTLAVIAADRRQARTVLRYINGFLDAVPMLRVMVTNRTKETVELNNRVVIEVHTANFRAVRGYTLIGVIADEIAFWPTDEAGASPDTEILNGLRPGMATIPGAMLIAISSPYARRGELFANYRKHWGQDGDPVLVWQAPTAVMNPNVDPQVIADAYAEDEASADAEYGANFRRDIESFVSREVIVACVIPDRHDLPPAADVRYRAFTDPSGGSRDSFTLAIAHKAGERTVIDALRETKPPFSPADVVKTYAELLKTYRVTSVTGDRYAGEWPREQFRKNGITYQVSEKVKNDLYRDLLPLLTSTRVELPDNPGLTRQLQGLERRTARGGKDSIDHAPRAHDDLANAVAGVAAVASVSMGPTKPGRTNWI
jgi:hypothetical protein